MTQSHTFTDFKDSLLAAHIHSCSCFLIAAGPTFGSVPEIEGVAEKEALHFCPKYPAPG